MCLALACDCEININKSAQAQVACLGGVGTLHTCSATVQTPVRTPIPLKSNYEKCEAPAGQIVASGRSKS
eukprot:scaffold134915_cov17-Prasinocladus_malaysianus.AAC.1